MLYPLQARNCANEGETLGGAALFPNFRRIWTACKPLGGKIPSRDYLRRGKALRSIVRKRRPGWGLSQARLPSWLTPTRLAFGQPPSPQGGGIRAARSRWFSYAIA